MILEIISKLKNQLLEDSKVEELYKEYIYSKQLEERIAELAKSYAELESNIKELQGKINSYGLLKKIFERSSFKALKQELEYLKIQKETVQTEYLGLKENLEQIQFKPEELKKIENYTSILDLEKDYSMGTYNSVIDTLMEYFNSNIKNLISYCNNNGILLNFSGEVEEMFLSTFANNNVPKEVKKPSSLDDLALVRKVDGYPVNDKIIPATHFLTTERISDKVGYDGNNYEFKIMVPKGHSTVSFCMNQEVLDHDTSELSTWNGKDYIIIQPLTNRLYDEAAGLDPVDVVFEGAVDLENYIIICKNIEQAQDIMKLNYQATVIVAPPEKIDGMGNLILSALGIHPFYDTYNGRNVIKLKNELYDEQFASKYPKLLLENVRGPQNDLHNLGEYARDEICYFSGIMDNLIKLSEKEENYDESFTKLLDSVSQFNLISYDRFRDKKINFSELVSGYESFGYFLDFMTSLNIQSINPDIIFNELIKDIEINENNKYSFISIKEKVITMFYNVDLKKNEDYNLFLQSLLFFRKIVTSPIVNKKVVNKFEYTNKIPIDYYDFTKFGELLDDIGSSDEVIDFWDLVQKTGDIKEIVELPVKKQNSLINEFVAKIESYVSIPKEERENFILNELDFDVSESVLIQYLDMVSNYPGDNILEIQQILCFVKTNMPQLLNSFNEKDNIK